MQDRFRLDGGLGLSVCARRFPLSYAISRRGFRFRVRLALPGLLVSLLLAAPLGLLGQFAGNDGNGPPARNGNPRDPLNADRDSLALSPQQQEKMADRRNSERQKQLVADTEKLFQLAQQLRDEVAKSNKDQLSVPVVKKSEEIEKLARSVKDKMRGY